MSRLLNPRRALAIVAIGLGGALLAGCGSAAPAADGPQASSSRPQQSPPPVAAADVTLEDIFPAGGGRDLVLNTCGSCHAVACSAQGRRTAARWEDLKKGHRETVTGVSNADYDALFAYLAEHFNDTKPEPRIPAKFLEQGCTPY